MTSSPGLLGAGPVDSTVVISFRRNNQEPAASELPFNFPGWWPPQIIRDQSLSPERLDNGRRWRFRLRLEDRRQQQAGNIVLELVLDGALPNAQDWPRSR